MTGRTLIILGAGGDLTRRLLLPGLDGVLAQAEAGGDADPLQLIGAGHHAVPQADWRDQVRTALGRGALRDAVVAGTRFEEADATDPDALRSLLETAEHPPILYFALPPAVTERAIEALSDVDLPPDTRLALEKPFGVDGASAARLNAALARLLPESRTFRIDHFLGLATVINLLGLRFANRVLEALWSAEHVERVDIVFDETLALEGRAGYYDRAGALVDMIQSHLLLVHALVAMEAPASVNADDLHDAMADALSRTRVVGTPSSATRRARYAAGEVDGRSVPDYASEEGVDPERRTETLAEIEVEVDAPRWRGVRFTVRSGKALGSPLTELRLTLRPVEHRPSGLRGTQPPAMVRIALMPERLSIDLDINGAGDPFDLDRVRLESEFGAGQLSAYGEVLSGILTGDDTLSVRGDLAEECWRIVEPVLDAWRRDDVELEEYAAGSAGPAHWSAR
ncbi:MAG: glucose-6-phosphate dehydrogenase [Microcella sp.]|uniref:glucose-6-phosphate dehydrogenase n=1 Tax=Microcella sp. TaxID=1913979 RepID=UPI00331649F0